MDIEGLKRELKEAYDKIETEEENFEQSYSSYHTASEDITDVCTKHNQNSESDIKNSLDG